MTENNGFYISLLTVALIAIVPSSYIKKDIPHRFKMMMYESKALYDQMNGHDSRR